MSGFQPQVCADHCNANPRCEGFVIMPSEQQCWMRGFINMGMCKFETKHYDLYVTDRQPLEPADSGFFQERSFSRDLI